MEITKKIIYLKKIIMLITCVHCGKSFNAKRLDNLSSASNGSIGIQHSPGCGKSNRVHFTRGSITKIV